MFQVLDQLVIISRSAESEEAAARWSEEVLNVYCWSREKDGIANNFNMHQVCSIFSISPYIHDIVTVMEIRTTP